MPNTGLIQRFRNRRQPPTPILIFLKLVISILSVARIAMGAVYLNDCPRQHYIPIYLIVVGVFGLVLAALSFLPCAKIPEDGTPNRLTRACRTWNSLISLFLFCWFITGSVWIHSIFQPDYNITSGDLYCNRTLYLFAFWSAIAVTVLLVLLLVVGLLALVCSYLCGRSDADDSV